jgi:hypothetical protein
MQLQFPLPFPPLYHPVACLQDQVSIGGGVLQLDTFTAERYSLALMCITLLRCLSAGPSEQQRQLPQAWGCVPAWAGCDSTHLSHRHWGEARNSRRGTQAQVSQEAPLVWAIRLLACISAAASPPICLMVEWGDSSMSGFACSRESIVGSRFGAAPTV